MAGHNQTYVAELAAIERSVTIRRVLLAVNLNPSQKFGSLEEQIFLMSVEMARQGGVLIPVFAQEMDEAHRVRYRQAGLTVGALDLNRFRLRTFHRLLRMITDGRIQVVHWNLYPPANLYVMLLRLLRPAIQHVLTDHNSRPPDFQRNDTWWKNIIKKTFAAAYSGVYAVSDYVQHDLKRQAIWREPLRYHHFVNTDRFKPDREAGAVLRAAMRCEDAFVLLVVAHLIPEKGVDVVIRVLRSLPSRTVLWIVGEGPERLNLQSLAQTFGVQERVILLGMRDDVCLFMQAADCFICPSLWQEAAGLVILEAMACGLPVVASDVGGIPEFVMAGRTGYLFPAGDMCVLAEHLKALSESNALAAEMSRSARAHAVAHFSHTTRVADAISLYESYSS
jgi:glycosyltransferase involved in cell wall biosynthesis